MEKSRKMNKIKYILVIVTILSTFNCLSQSLDKPEPMDFYVIDTITISNPFVFYKPNQSGRFIGNLEFFNKDRIRLKKVVKRNDVYIYSSSLYGFLSSNEFEKYDYPDYGNCSFENDYYKEIKGVVYQKFKKEPNRYVLGLINVSYYNSKITTYGEKQSVFRKYDNSLYYKIVFPLCE